MSDCYISLGTDQLPETEKCQHEKRKRSTSRLSQRIREFAPDLADKLLSCGTSLFFSRPQCGHTKFTRSWFSHHCDNRICPICSHRKSVTLANTLGKALSIYASKHNLHAYFVTLTLKNMYKLPSINVLQLFRRKFFDGLIWQQYGLHGGTWNLEVIPGNRSALWHPHFHCLVFTDQPLLMYPNASGKLVCDLALHKSFADLWRRVTKGRGQILDIREFNGKYFEIFKYVFKHQDDMTDRQLKSFVLWQYRKVFRGLFGKLYRNKELSDLRLTIAKKGEHELRQKTVCPVCGEDMQQVLCYRWNSLNHRYIFDKSMELSLFVIGRIFPHFKRGP